MLHCNTNVQTQAWLLVYNNININVKLKLQHILTVLVCNKNDVNLVNETAAQHAVIFICVLISGQLICIHGH